MSVANPSFTAPSRKISHTVRLAPYLVETLCELTRAVRDKTHAQTEITGLLFGTAGEEVTTVEALRSFEDTGPRSDMARRERLDRAFDNAMAQADEDPELAACRLVGWFSLRSSSGLLSSDVAFHNRHFKQAEDLALVVWREADTQVIAELYARTENRTLSGSDYRWSSVRLSTELRRVSEPIDLAMRAKVTADSYLRAYQNTEDDEKRHDLKKIASSVKRTALALMPKLPKREREKEKDYSLTAAEPPRSYGRQLTDAAALLRRDEEYPEPLARLEPSRAPAPYRAMRYPEGELSGLPMVIQTPKQRPSGVPWLSTALVFIAFSAITFAVLAVKGSDGGNGKLAQIMRVIFPSGDLGLHVESQGDRLLLSWNRRNAAVTAASDGVLQIFDGATHREVKLNGEQVADGSVLYKPLTQDVTFRLEIHAAGQPATTGSMRVLDATSASHEAPVLDVTPSSVAPVSVTPASVRPPPSATQARTPAPQQPVNPMPVPDTARAAAEKTPPPAAVSAPAPAHNVPARTQSAKTEIAQNNQSPAPSAQPPHSASPRPDSPPQTQAASVPSAQPPAAGSIINGWDSSAPAAPRTVPTATVASFESRAPVFIPPKPLSQVMPNTRTLAPGTISQVTRVEVTVRIDNTGHVLSAHVLNENGNGKSGLSAAALAAARQWTFQPATLQGEKVESEHTIVFEFRPESQ
ncbi:MAG TPA: TonB family protein [Bryobacteraceae bacterium]